MESLLFRVPVNANGYLQLLPVAGDFRAAYRLQIIQVTGINPESVGKRNGGLLLQGSLSKQAANVLIPLCQGQTAETEGLNTAPI
ncbi:MAG: hypothetical protein AAF502_19730 [Bacteroidota bacterium]